jgi:hypothetical protein
MEKIETRGRPRNLKFGDISRGILTEANKLLKDACFTMTVPHIKSPDDQKRLRQSRDYIELREALMRKGYIVRLFYHKKCNTLICSLSR